MFFVLTGEEGMSESGPREGVIERLEGGQAFGRFLLLVLCIEAFAASGGRAPGDTQWLLDRSQAERIQRVERGMPSVPRIGKQPLRMDVAGWMKFFEIPGLSIAVFDDDRIVWIRDYRYVPYITQDAAFALSPWPHP